MIIFHYSLGFPPYRTGGLTRYALDIAKEQSMEGHIVSLIWPGRINPLLRDGFSYHGGDFGIQSIELINPLPVPLLNGIRNTNLYMQTRNISVFRKFFREQKPDVIHIHTLMGLPKEFLLAAKESSIKLIYTTHDYFGLCPKVSFFCNSQVCSNKESCKDCYQCNENAFSYPMIIAMQSALYRKLKENSFIKTLKKIKKKNDNISQQLKSNITLNNENINHYKRLRNYYISLYTMIDTFHFNSNLSKQVYEYFISPKYSSVIPILHADIHDRRKIKKFGNTLKIAYMAETKAYKGFFVLLDALDSINLKGKNDFTLRIFSRSDIKKDYIIESDHYNISELEDIFDETDLVVVPSICLETFGFVVLEALSFGVPVIVTENVGSKDLVGDMGFVIQPTEKSLAALLEKIYDDRTLLNKCNESIVSGFHLDFDFSHHVNKIMELYHDE